MIQKPQGTHTTSYKPLKLCSGYGPNGPHGRRSGVTNPEDLTAIKDAPFLQPSPGQRRNPSTTNGIHDDSVFMKGPGASDRTRIHDDSVFMHGPDSLDRSRVHDDSVFMQVPDISKMFGG